MSHNDFKPANILWKQVDGTKAFKLADGGCSTVTKTLQSVMSRGNAGNDQYRPPVNAETGLSRWQRASGDVFAMAVLVFYLASSKFP